ncbi:MAG TPA: thioredoxin domain-containing protein, partial [Flavitalea sp.]|nr:thioredoxin domain-containing protein [Flavitalea sp.]
FRLSKVGLPANISPLMKNVGLDKGVRDVPTFFINGEMFAGKPTFESLKKAIAETIRIQKAPARKRA